jgi:hypothetical protein
MEVDSRYQRHQVTVVLLGHLALTGVIERKVYDPKSLVSLTFVDNQIRSCGFGQAAEFELASHESSSRQFRSS